MNLVAVVHRAVGDGIRCAADREGYGVVILQSTCRDISDVDALFSFWGVLFSFKIDIIKNLLSRTLQISWNRNFVKFGAL